MSRRIEIAKNFAREMKSEKIGRMILFGSVARGDDHSHSDIDILVVSNHRKEIWPKISHIIADTVMNEGELLSVHVMPENIFNETRDYSFLTNVKRRNTSRILDHVLFV